MSGEPVEDDPTPVAEAGVGEEPPRPEEPPAQIAEEILTEFRTLMDAGVRDRGYWPLANMASASSARACRASQKNRSRTYPLLS